MKARLFFSAILIASAAISSVAHAQVVPGVSTSDISINLSPQFPGANQSVVVSVSSYAVDLDASTISWTENGAQVASGQGVKSITIKTGAIGSRTTVGVTISNSETSLSKDIIIAPNSINLIWEALTYTPPFFKGKALYTAGSAVKFVADPEFSGNDNPSTFVYTWIDNGTVLSDVSGAGKSSVIIPGQLIPRPENITVNVVDPLTGENGQSSINLNSVNAQVLLYQNDPLYGIEWNRALDARTDLSGDEIDLAAIPYYFSVSNPANPSITYTWSVNGQNVSGSSPYQNFRRSGNDAGESSVSVSASDPYTLFQTGAADTMVVFPATNQTSL